MTLFIERAGTKRRVTWLTVLGIALLPAVLGAVLVGALYNPTDRLDQMTAAVVNEDAPVTLNGQLVPLGRQLTAGLVEGSKDIPSNITWVVSNADDAASGLADGTYQAAVTIPETFSAAATSTAGDAPVQATIDVQTAPDARIVDDAITTQVTQAAANLMGRELSKVYLENVFLGFTKLGGSLGEAADGAQQLADGATSASDGAVQLADGGTQLADGAAQLSDGASQLSTGAGGISTGATGISTGATGLADGLTSLSDGAGQLSAGIAQVSSGLTDWAAGATSAATAARALADGVAQIADGVANAPGMSEEQRAGLQALVDGAPALSQGLTGSAGAFTQLAATCADSGASTEFCAQLTTLSAQNSTLADAASGAVTGGAGAAAGLLTAAAPPTELVTGLQSAATGASQLADGVDALSTGATTASGGAAQLATAASQLAGGATDASSGATQLAGGASQLAGGASQLAGGATALATGATGLSDGAGALSTGTVSLADGVAKLATGAGDLAGGLSTASTSVPSYTDQQAKTLANVVSDPVTAAGGSASVFGAGAIPLLAIVVLWFGGLASYVAMQAATRRALASRRPSVLLTLRALAPGAAIGAAQGALVAAVLQIAGRYDLGTFFSLLGLTVLAGVAFAAVHQGLVAVFGGAGRWIGAIVGAFAVATSIVSTVPPVLAGIAAALPTAPGAQALSAVLASSGGLGAAVAALVAWAVGGIVATTLAVARRRSTSAVALVAAATA